jgi:hypothetical protein
MTGSLLLHCDGAVTEIELPAATEDSLAAKYRHMGCWRVEVVQLTSTLDMWIDEEGLFTQPVNPVATALAQRYGCAYQAYHGPAIICSLDGEGNSVNLTRDQLVAVLTQLADIAGV